MDSVKELIFKMKRRPELYIGARSLSLLQAYINGWIDRSEDTLPDVHLIGRFQDWIEQKYNVEASQSWANIILFYSVDERDALDNFFRLFEKFLREQEVANS